ncbi:hypothetical protein [Desulfosarcina ovata]|uniref:ResB-like domain-containing protein n=1 Tax=Desulfosarcina ovata subsp. ovata TaxID=2752305 RepID=A0A5K8AC15_9BACT|nr:hypothetical protein [Desulfosarcina ovata]BBO90157.1 hypothetical protein DSCOOX_33370 [Desulfosarcina ovata subsp. ovata]
MKRIWTVLGDIRVAVVLLMMASATLFTGTFYAGRNFVLFSEMNRQTVQAWLAMNLSARPETVWWVPVLFVIMGALGLNTFICATNRFVQIVAKRQSLTRGRFVYLLIPSMVHFTFIIIMLGHLTTFVTGSWQTLSLETNQRFTVDGSPTPYRVQAIEDRYFPAPSAMGDQISQTVVTLSDADQDVITLRYGRPVRVDGRFFFLDKIKQKRRTKTRIAPPADDPTCNQAEVFNNPGKTPKRSDQLLLVVSDPGLAVILCGLALILCLMTGYFLVQTANNRHGRKVGKRPAAIAQQG